MAITRFSVSATLSILAAGFSTAAPVNQRCIISGDDVDPAISSKITVVVAYCCNDCAAEAGDEFNREKMGKAIAEAAAEPVNSNCPVSGEPTDSKKTLQHDDKLVAFCSTTCRNSFKKSPSSFASKVATDSPGNQKCPISGDRIEPASVYPITIEYAFCSGSCQRKFDRARARTLKKIVGR